MLAGGAGRDFLDGGFGSNVIHCGAFDQAQDAVVLHFASSGGGAFNTIGHFGFEDRLLLVTHETGISSLVNGFNFFFNLNPNFNQGTGPTIVFDGDKTGFCVSSPVSIICFHLLEGNIRAVLGKPDQL